MRDNVVTICIVATTAHYTSSVQTEKLKPTITLCMLEYIRGNTEASQHVYMH